MRIAKRVLLSIALSSFAVGGVVAQDGPVRSRRPFTLVVSGAFANLSGESHEGLTGGPGFEGQLRYGFPGRFGGLSVGVGYQRTMHSAERPNTDMTFAGAFLEPRLVVRTFERVAPYLSARVAFLSQDFNADDFSGSTSGTSFGGGAGLMFRLGARTILDGGLSFGHTTFKDERALVTDIPSDEPVYVNLPSGSGSALLTRFGVAFRL